MKKSITLFLLLGLVVGASAQVYFQTSNLPIVIINTNGQEIPDEPKITAQMGIIDNGPGHINRVSDPHNVYDGYIGIELRGSSSFYYDKKPYGIETRDASGEDLNVSLLGMPEESDWVLLSPLNDKTLMRDVLAYAYARSAMPWAPRTRYCEVVINGDYKGVYFLGERIKRDKNRVDIKKLDSNDISGDKVTGGYILRMDKYGPTPGTIGGNWASHYPPMPGAWQTTWFQYFYPKEEDITPEQAAYIQKYIGDFEDMLMSDDYKSHYADWIDVDTWVDYLLVNELTKNTDAYRLSAYFYKNRDSEGGKLKMGPVWDFNIAFGIGDYCNGQYYFGWAKDFNSVCSQDGWIIHFWWDRLWQDPAFRDRIGRRWEELRSSAWSNEKLFGTIDSIATLLDVPKNRNFQRWPVLGTYVWPNSYIGNTYQDEVNYLRTWLTNRLGWLDENLSAFVTAPDDEITSQNVSVYPNPTTGHIWIQLPKDAPGQQYNLVLYDALGKEIFRQKDLSFIHSAQLDLSPALSSGLYLWQVVDKQGHQASGKLILQR